MAGTPALSVVIPTHQRAGILRLCLQHLERQSCREDLETIIVSDGHDPETAALFENKNAWGFPVRFFEIEKSQQGRARNRGVDLARGNHILFIGDDAFLQPHACAAHLEAHKRIGRERKSAVLGFTTWNPALRITRLMRWLETSGWQFGYPFLEPYRRAFVPRGMQHRFTYAINLSLPRETACEHRFREDIALYGWEDIEWGKRLADTGIGLYYEPTAIAFHHHPITLAESLTRVETLGHCAQAIASLSDFDPRPRGKALLAHRLRALLPNLAGRHSRAFLRGLHRHPA